jgi:hypothetical protein
MSLRRRAPAPAAPALRCPSCGAGYGAGARFCEHCRLPLVFDGPGAEPMEALSPRHERARKVKPQLAEGALVSVAHARNQAEGEFIQGLLLEEGVPSLLRRSAGFDVPDFLAGGPRDVLVAQSGADTAREVLLEAEIVAGAGVSSRPVAPARLAAGLLVALVIGGLAVWLLSLAFH